MHTNILESERQGDIRRAHGVDIVPVWVMLSSELLLHVQWSIILVETRGWKYRQVEVDHPSLRLATQATIPDSTPLIANYYESVGSTNVRFPTRCRPLNAALFIASHYSNPCSGNRVPKRYAKASGACGRSSIFEKASQRQECVRGNSEAF